MLPVPFVELLQLSEGLCELSQAKVAVGLLVERAAEEKHEKGPSSYSDSLFSHAVKKRESFQRASVRLLSVASFSQQSYQQLHSWDDLEGCFSVTGMQLEAF